MKRLLDILVAFLGLSFISPILIAFIYLVYRQDKADPIYRAPRVGVNGSEFRMIKLRSMIIFADKNKVDSTSLDDKRITPLGKIIRKYKLDELTQLWNVLVGDMSLVGPRPNVKRDVDLYSDVEMKLLTVRPGITDFSSIVFSDEGDILEGVDDPDLSYNQLIRPWKSRLGILYIENQGLLLDIKLMLLTLIAIFNKPAVLNIIVNELKKLTTDPELIKICKRDADLKPAKPPGLHEVVKSRDL